MYVKKRKKRNHCKDYTFFLFRYFSSSFFILGIHSTTTTATEKKIKEFNHRFCILYFYYLNISHTKLLYTRNKKKKQDINSRKTTNNHYHYLSNFTTAIFINENKFRPTELSLVFVSLLLLLPCFTLWVKKQNYYYYFQLYTNNITKWAI